jgi:catechol 2,3-dioxygenase-like lactoylglutathione lyase family enzyme
MRIEHLAFNVKEAPAMISWYQEHLGMPIHFKSESPVYVAFLGEAPGIMEIYNNPEKPYLDFKSLHQSAFHLAFVSLDLKADIERLEKAGATLIDDDGMDKDGYGTPFLRCPFGLPIQLCRRRTPIDGN